MTHMYATVMYSLLHLECHFSNLKTEWIIHFVTSLLPRSAERNPLEKSIGFRLENVIECHSTCNSQVQPIAFGVSSNNNLQSQSPWSLFNGTYLKRRMKKCPSKCISHVQNDFCISLPDTVCKYVYVHVCVHVCMCACMHVCMYACVHVCYQSCSCPMQ